MISVFNLFSIHRDSYLAWVGKCCSPNPPTVIIGFEQKIIWMSLLIKNIKYPFATCFFFISGGFRPRANKERVVFQLVLMNHRLKIVRRLSLTIHAKIAGVRCSRQKADSAFRPERKTLKSNCALILIFEWNLCYWCYKRYRRQQKVKPARTFFWTNKRCLLFQTR